MIYANSADPMTTCPDDDDARAFVTIAMAELARANDLHVRAGGDDLGAPTSLQWAHGTEGPIELAISDDGGDGFEITLTRDHHDSALVRVSVSFGDPSAPIGPGAAGSWVFHVHV